MRRIMSALVLAATLLGSGGVVCAAPSGAHPRIVMVVAPKDFTDRELAGPKAVFEKAGSLVRVASTTRAAAVSHDGEKVAVDLAIREIALDQLDALVVVGGVGAMTYLMDDEALRKVVVAAARSGKVVAAICLAPAVLAHDGVLRNLKATCFPDKRIVATLKRNGADYSESSVVVAGRIVTANGPDASKDFALRVLEAVNQAAD